MTAVMTGEDYETHKKGDLTTREDCGTDKLRRLWITKIRWSEDTKILWNTEIRGYDKRLWHTEVWDITTQENCEKHKQKDMTRN